jgi:hypothetical protein
MFNIVNDAADPNILYLFVNWLERRKDWLAAPLGIMPGIILHITVCVLSIPI